MLSHFLSIGGSKGAVWQVAFEETRILVAKTFTVVHRPTKKLRTGFAFEGKEHTLLMLEQWYEVRWLVETEVQELQIMLNIK